MSPVAILWLSAAIPVFLAAASASRAFVGNGIPLILALSLVLYCIGNLMMVRVMRESGLGIAISASAIAQLILATLVAFAVFGERPPVRQLVGMGLGLAGFVLMIWPTGGR